MNTKYLLCVIFITSITISWAQNVTGLWEIKNVKVGSQTMTPVAKWTRINKDGTYQSGNGWLKNSEGTWAFDAGKKLFSLHETQGLIDQFGPFTVEFTDTGMNWLREEEGMIVTVLLNRVDEIPKGPADKVVGLWGLTTITKDNVDITTSFDPDKKYYTFIRWDRIYVNRSAKQQRNTGYWHMHGHKPEITFLPHTKDSGAESWRVEVVDDGSLKLKGISDSNKNTVMTFKKLNQFPK